MKNALETIRKFVDERDWNEVHNPKNLSMSIAIEAAELMEIFQWMDINASRSIMESNEKEHVEEELADVLIYCFSLCNKLNLDPLKIMNSKIKKNELKYPYKNKD